MHEKIWNEQLMPEILEWVGRFGDAVVVEHEAVRETRVYPTRPAIFALPEEVRKQLCTLARYPSQMRACFEVLDAIVRRPTGLRRFISGGAGKGESSVKRCMAKILRSVGLEVKVIVVAAIVAQDDDSGEGSAIALSLTCMAEVRTNSFGTRSIIRRLMFSFGMKC